MLSKYLKVAVPAPFTKANNQHLNSLIISIVEAVEIALATFEENKIVDALVPSEDNIAWEVELTLKTGKDLHDEVFRRPYSDVEILEEVCKQL